MSPNVPMMTEQASFLERLDSARRGDREATDWIIARTYPRVERLVHARLRQDIRRGRGWLSTRFSTGDLVQEVFRSALGGLAEFEGDNEEELVAYLAGISRNRIVDAIRFHEAERRDGRNQISDAGVFEQLTADRPGPATQAASLDDQRTVQEAIRLLSETDQAVLHARISEEVTFAELAKRLGLPSAATARREFFAVQARLAVSLRGRVNP